MQMVRQACVYRVAVLDLSPVQDLCQPGISVYSQWVQKHSLPLNFSSDLLCQQWLIKIWLLSTGSNHDLATILFAVTNLAQDFTDFSLRCGCHLSKSMKNRIWWRTFFFPQFLALNGAEPASHHRSHRTITFRDQLALPLQKIAAKAHGRSMS